jgi:hypothetical protein
MIVDPSLLSSLLQGLGLACGLGGAVYVASCDRGDRRFGFLLWIISDLAWLGAGICLASVFLFVQFGFYLFTAAMGLRNNLPEVRSEWRR